MSDIVSLELLFDTATETQIREEWRVLQELGVSSMGAHTGASNRPHLSLLVRSPSPDDARGEGESAPADAASGQAGPGGPPLLDIDAVRDAVGGLPIALTLGGPQLFTSGTRAVLARSVVPSAGLLEFHAQLHERAGDAEIAVDLPHTTPGTWTPHVTLARRLKLADLELAVSALELAPLHALATELRLWDARVGTVQLLRGA
ncbi:2'-5' RNA ligase family protein [Pseudoclavibacter sp. VKM Ac-2867]|uniref:2'-5' RNA ligase family protein n=1 Tax=Pseudoclavibacter sp. VKM Ac-2867 TaxID=2783829 RepID=UPI002B26FEDB|nr:2'-5' RNA ligase family protein [Pseudoclavibacter sp. VKM Ac-2867]